MRLLITGWLLGFVVLLAYPQALVFWLCVPLVALAGWGLVAFAQAARPRKY